jgi:DNA-binding NarL/FixJ family response regulator
MRIVIADDHVLFRQGLIQLLRSAENVTVVGETGDGHELLRLIERCCPDVAILDVSMPGPGVAGILAELRRNGSATRPIILTMHNDPVLAAQVLHSGGAAYVLKDTAFDELLTALRTVAAGGDFVSPTLAVQLVKSSDNAATADPLSDRELEILKLIVQGCTNKKTARQLDLSIKTVETHRANIMQKLKVHSTAELVRIAIERRLA